MLHTAQATKNSFGFRSNENARFFAFAVLRQKLFLLQKQQKKRLLKHRD